MRILSGVSLDTARCTHVRNINTYILGRRKDSYLIFLWQVIFVKLPTYNFIFTVCTFFGTRRKKNQRIVRTWPLMLLEIIFLSKMKRKSTKAMIIYNATCASQSFLRISKKVTEGTWTTWDIIDITYLFFVTGVEYAFKPLKKIYQYSSQEDVERYRINIYKSTTVHFFNVEIFLTA